MAKDEHTFLKLLILDHEWHRVFDGMKTLSMKRMEKKLGELLKEQGRLSEDYKAYKTIKKELMDKIMQGMQKAMHDPKLRKTIERHKHKIETINHKLEQIEQRQSVLPSEIYDLNERLLDASMALYYETIRKVKKQQMVLDQTIAELRETIKVKMLEKNEAEQRYEALYHYIHGLVGPDRIDDFDHKFLNDLDHKDDLK